MLADRPLLRFALTVLALLPMCFIAWIYLGTLLAAPAVLLVKIISTNWLTGFVTAVQLDGTVMLALSSLGEENGVIAPAQDIGNQLAIRMDTRTLSYSVPFYAALHFSTPMASSLERFARSLVILWILLFLGLLATLLKDLMLGLGEQFLSTPGVPPAEVIALGYQFSTLLVPPLAPILLWAFSARDVPAFRELLPRSLSPPARGRETGAGEQ